MPRVEAVGRFRAVAALILVPEFSSRITSLESKVTRSFPRYLVLKGN